LILFAKVYKKVNIETYSNITLTRAAFSYAIQKLFEKYGLKNSIIIAPAQKFEYPANTIITAPINTATKITFENYRIILLGLSELKIENKINFSDIFTAAFKDLKSVIRLFKNYINLNTQAELTFYNGAFIIQKFGDTNNINETDNLKIKLKNFDLKLTANTIVFIVDRNQDDKKMLINIQRGALTIANLQFQKQNMNNWKIIEFSDNKQHHFYEINYNKILDEYVEKLTFDIYSQKTRDILLTEDLADYNGFKIPVFLDEYSQYLYAISVKALTPYKLATLNYTIEKTKNIYFKNKLIDLSNQLSKIYQAENYSTKQKLSIKKK